MKHLLVYLNKKQDEGLILEKFKTLMDALEQNRFQEAYFLVGVAQEAYWEAVLRKSKEAEKQRRLNAENALKSHSLDLRYKTAIYHHRI